MKRNRLSVLLLCLAALLVVLPVQAQPERLQIVASYTILADVVRNVVGDAADVTTLIPPGADPHTFAPSPGDLARIADADVVFIVGINFEENVIEAIEEAAADVNVVVVSSCVRVIASGGHSHDHDHDEEHGDAHDHDEAHDDHDHAEDAAGMVAARVDSAIAALCAEHDAIMAALHEHDHDHDADEAHDHEHDHAHDHDHMHGSATVLGPLYTLDCGDGHSHEDDHDHAEDDTHGHDHDHGVCDPHVWTDPHNVIYWTLMIRDTLVTLDAANAALYTANAAAYIEALDELAHDFIMPMVASIPKDRRILLTNHETLGYFAHAYGFEIIATVIPGAGTLAEPSAADIAALIDLIRAENVPAVFAETTVSARIAEQVAAESGAAFYTLYSDSLSEPGGPAATYIDYIRYNVTTIVEALGGAQ